MPEVAGRSARCPAAIIRSAVSSPSLCFLFRWIAAFCLYGNLLLHIEHSNLGKETS